MSDHAIAQGDVLENLREIPDNTFDAILSDPPYGLSFMGKKWDYDVPSVAVWHEALRVLKPGGALLAFGGSRTYHRMAVNIEDAGFEMRDCLLYLYGKGFPKSLNVGKALDALAGAKRTVRPLVDRNTGEGLSAISANKDCGLCGKAVYGGDLSQACKCPKDSGPITDLAKQWGGYGTALKPAFEPIILARKPLDGTVANNVTKWGCGALAIDACRIGNDGGTTKGNPPKGESNGIYGDGINGSCDVVDIGAGRWPANLALDEDAAAMLDGQAGNRPSRPSITRNGGGNQGGDVFTGRTGKAKPDSGYSDSGGPSRFFYTSKVSTREREYGCEHLPLKSAGEMTNSNEDDARLDSPRTGAGRGGGARNVHPTLKPLALTTWLARLILPPTDDATLLVPYSGAGSEMIGALLAGWPSVFGIEGEQEYITIAEARIAAWLKKERAA